MLNSKRNILNQRLVYFNVKMFLFFNLIILSACNKGGFQVSTFVSTNSSESLLNSNNNEVSSQNNILKKRINPTETNFDVSRLQNRGIGISGLLEDHNGPVIDHPTFIPLFIGTSWVDSKNQPTSKETDILSFINSLSKSDYLNLTNEYLRGLNLIVKEVKAPIFNKTSLIPKNSDPNIDNIDILTPILQNEVCRQLDAQTGIYDQPVFLIFSDSIADSDYCGFHNSTKCSLPSNPQKSITVEYSYVPSLEHIDGCDIDPNKSGLYLNHGSELANIASVVAHEVVELITNPETGKNGAWFDILGEEIADICAWEYDTNPQELTKGEFYYLPKEYSNYAKGCIANTNSKVLSFLQSNLKSVFNPLILSDQNNIYQKYIQIGLGESVSLSTTFNSTTPVIVYWKLNEHIIFRETTKEDRISTYKIPYYRSSHDGTYSVFAQNADGLVINKTIINLESNNKQKYWIKYDGDKGSRIRLVFPGGINGGSSLPAGITSMQSIPLTNSPNIINKTAIMYGYIGFTSQVNSGSSSVYWKWTGDSNVTSTASGEIHQADSTIEGCEGLRNTCNIPYSLDKFYIVYPNE